MKHQRNADTVFKQGLGDMAAQAVIVARSRVSVVTRRHSRIATVLEGGFAIVLAAAVVSAIALGYAANHRATGSPTSGSTQGGPAGGSPEYTTPLPTDALSDLPICKPAMLALSSFQFGAPSPSAIGKPSAAVLEFSASLVSTAVCRVPAGLELTLVDQNGQSLPGSVTIWSDLPPGQLSRSPALINIGKQQMALLVAVTNWCSAPLRRWSPATIEFRFPDGTSWTRSLTFPGNTGDLLPSSFAVGFSRSCADPYPAIDNGALTIMPTSGGTMALPAH